MFIGVILCLNAGLGLAFLLLREPQQTFMEVTHDIFNFLCAVISGSFNLTTLTHISHITVHSQLM